MAAALSHKAGLSSTFGYLAWHDLIISAITGTISRLIDNPVSIRPTHINSIDYGKRRSSEGPKKSRAKTVVKSAERVRKRFSSTCLLKKPTKGPKNT